MKNFVSDCAREKRLVITKVKEKFWTSADENIQRTGNNPKQNSRDDKTGDTHLQYGMKHVTEML